MSNETCNSPIILPSKAIKPDHLKYHVRISHTGNNFISLEQNRAKKLTLWFCCDYYRLPFTARIKQPKRAYLVTRFLLCLFYDYKLSASIEKVFRSGQYQLDSF